MNRENLILAVVAAALGLALWLGEPTPIEPAAEIPLTSLTSRDITDIALFLGDEAEPRITLSRANADWALTSPVQTPADPFAIGEILKLAQTPIRNTLAADSLKLADLKLAPPLWRVRLNELELQIGAIESLRQQRYVKLGEQLLLVDDFNPGPIDGNYADLVSLRLLPPSASIQSIRWPDQLKKNAAAISPQKLELWTNARAQWTATPLPSDLAAATSRITLALSDRSVDFLIAEREPRVKLIRPDINVLYNLPGSAAKELLEP